MTLSHSVAAKSPLPELCVHQDTTKRSSSSRRATCILLLPDFMNCMAAKKQLVKDPSKEQYAHAGLQHWTRRMPN